MTPEQEKDIAARVDSFQKEYVALVEKHEVGFVVVPQYIPIGPNVYGTTFSLSLADKKYAPKESPFMKDSVIKE